jgi:1,4-dihydroxy-2-naphthoyl-CoA hydrolase
MGVSFEGALDDFLGFELVEAGADGGVARMPITDRVRQRFGVVHGGAHAALAEMLASEATVAAVADPDKLVMGSSNFTTFLRPVTEGTVTARARALHRGRTSWVWDVELSGDDGRLCAVSRVTIAVRER